MHLWFHKTSNFTIEWEHLMANVEESRATRQPPFEENEWDTYRNQQPFSYETRSILTSGPYFPFPTPDQRGN